LIVGGSTSGSSTLRVTNVGGAGAPTVEGIKVVDVAGASNGTFALLGGYVFHGQQAVVGGAYAYTLQQNGISTPGDGD
jgi:fibronectin-binding autotransporter adhesin